MCTSCQLPATEDISTDEFAGRLLDVLNHGALAVMISIGHRTGPLRHHEGSSPPSTSQ